MTSKNANENEWANEGAWTCPTCGSICMTDWVYCPYCGDTNPNDEE